MFQIVLVVFFFFFFNNHNDIIYLFLVIVYLFVTMKGDICIYIYFLSFASIAFNFLKCRLRCPRLIDATSVCCGGGWLGPRC